MSVNAAEKNIDLKVSKLAENIIGSEIIKLAAEVNEKIKKKEERPFFDLKLQLEKNCGSIYYRSL